ncbi:MAG TPA: TldD/PmbA family protein [Chloroflexia bacterium]|nr:TldD/PmbA family protein [Chloroflexia bacterium]
MYSAQLATILPEVVALIESKMPYGAALAMSTSGLSIQVDNREQHATRDPESVGVVLTAGNGLYLEEFATTTLDRAGLLAEARAWVAGLQVRATGANALPLDPGPPVHESFATPLIIDPAGVPMQEKFARVAARQAVARALDPRIANATIGYNESYQETLFANRTRLLHQQLVRLRLYTTLLVRDAHGTIQRDWDIAGGALGFELFDQVESPAYEVPLEALRDSALALLSAEHIEPGVYDCICAPDVAGTVAHESFGHGVETDMFLKGRARAADFLGQRMAAEDVNMCDDPTLPGAYGSYFFDDEGTLARPVPIIDRGVFVSGISDLYSAARMHLARTGNGRRQSFDRKAYARMSNTYFRPGTTPVEAMIAGVEHGVYVTQLSSGMEDPKNWGIQLVTQYGREIQHGQFTGRVFAPIGLTGSVPEVLASISQVGRDFKVDSGFCGKGHKEYVRISSGGPHLRLRARLS